MAIPADFSPAGVYGKQHLESDESTGSELWDNAIAGLREYLGGPPPIILTELAKRLSDDPFAERPEDQQTIFQQAKDVSIAAARLGFAVVRKVASFIFNMAKRFIFTLGRFILRGIIVPLLEGLAAILTSPIGLAAVGVIGIGALSYFLYKTFFKGQDADAALPEAEAEPPQGSTISEVLGNLWDKGVTELLGWTEMDRLQTTDILSTEQRVLAITGAAPVPGTEQRRIREPSTNESKERFKWAFREEFRKLGFTDAQISGMLGSIQQESNFDVNAFNPAGGGMGANGVMQWRGARWRRYLAFRAEHPEWDEATAQAKFAALEAVTDEASGYAKVKQTITPSQAAWAHGMYVERAGEGVHGERRARYAEAIYQKFLKDLNLASTDVASADVGTPKPITSKPSPGTASGPVGNNAPAGLAPPAPLHQDTQFLKTKHGPLPVGA